MGNDGHFDRERSNLKILKFVTVLAAFIVASAIFLATAKDLYISLMSLGYAGAFFSGLIGTSSLMISIFPPQIVVFILSDPSLGFSPLLIGVAAGVGAGIGQYAHYYIGEEGGHIIPEKYRKRIENWKPRIERYGAVLIFLFAATPLSPDDLVWIPLGIMKYPKKRALAASITGKTVMLVAFAYAGHYGLKAIRGWLRL